MLLVGLTGGIGSGKSTVAELLAAEGRGRRRRRRGRAGSGRARRAGARARWSSASGPGSSTPTAGSTGPRWPRSPSPTTRAARRWATSPGPRSARSSSGGSRRRRPTRSSSATCPLLVESKAAAARPYVAVIVVEAPVDAAPRPARGPGRGPRRRRARGWRPRRPTSERREVATHVVDNGGDLAHSARQVDAHLGRPRAPRRARHARAEAARAGPGITVTPRRYHRRRCRRWSSSPISPPRATSPRRSPRSPTGIERGDRFQTLLGITGSGKSFTIAGGHREGAAADARAGAQQDPRRPAGQRVPGAVPEEPGRVLRLLLRLLPARGLPPDDRHLHREGLVDQRRDRPAAPLGHRAR